jgi:Thrombospondin type 1 domain
MWKHACKECHGRALRNVLVVHAGDRPAGRHKVCHKQQCTAPYYQVGPWSSCSSHCGPGQQTRTVTCTTVAGPQATSKACAALATPKSVQTCTTGSCQSGRWLVTNYDPCNRACGGTQRNEITCKTANGTVLFGDIARTVCGSLAPPDQTACPPCPFCGDVKLHQVRQQLQHSL